MEQFNAAIVIVSSSCFSHTSEDRTGPVIADYLESRDWNTTIDIVDDDKAMIQELVRRLTADTATAPNLIVLSGGTGFTKKDVTPEAVKPLLDKEAPGIVHAMLSHSFGITPYAICSRPVAGVLNETLIVTIPGSPKGATENLDAIIDKLKHILNQLRVDSARELHKPSDHPSSEVKHSGHSHEHSHEHSAHSHDHSHEHSHQHSHGVKLHLLSNALNGPVSQRARKSPYPMVSVLQALDYIDKFTPKPSVIKKKLTDDDITGYVLAQDVFARVNVPDFNASIVDGYAVIHSDCPGTFPVVSVSHAAPGETKRIRSGTVVRVTTGAPIPLGTTAVIPVEETEVDKETADGEEVEVKILAMNVVEGDNIRKLGSDISKGALALPKGSRISRLGGEMGLLVSIGVLEVEVYAKPVIGVLSTGDELVDLSQSSEVPLKYGQIYDTNRPLLSQLFQGYDYKVVDFGISHDTLGKLAETVESAFERVDYLITTGGVSMGETDLLKPFIERHLGGTIHFGRVAMKPGKPTTFATFPPDHKFANKAIFALPGNPASASVTSNLFVLPSLMKFSGIANTTRSTVDVILNQDAKLDPRPEYQRVHISRQGDKLVADSTGFQRSSCVGSIAGANGLLVLPSSKDVPSGKLLKGSRAQAIIIDIL